MIVQLKNFKNIFLIPELRWKILFTLGLLIIDRLGTYIPVIGVNVQLLGEYMARSTNVGGLLGYLDIFSGGALRNCTLFALGIGPYITASIMIQLLSMIVPSLEQLVKEGEYGRQLVNQYTRYLTLALSIVYSSSYAILLESQGLVYSPGWIFRFIFILSLSVGALFVMWLGEQISLYGVGVNGSSVIIFASIVSRLPADVIKIVELVRQGSLDIVIALFMLVVFVVLTGCIVFLERGERKIPVQYARRVIGHRMYGGQSAYIPFKINTAGIMPVIFATSILHVPQFIIGILASRFTALSKIANIFVYQSFLYNTLDFFLIVFFSFFYTALMYNPIELADNIKKSGGFIPGYRPGKKTAQFFDYILTRIGLVGAVYLGVLAIAPNILYSFIEVPFSLGGTSMLIMIGVALEMSAQIESFLIEHRYEGFLSSGRLKGRTAR